MESASIEESAREDPSSIYHPACGRYMRALPKARKNLPEVGKGKSKSIMQCALFIKGRAKNK